MKSPRKEVRPSILIKRPVTAFLHINYVPTQCLATILDKNVKKNACCMFHFRILHP